MPASKLNYIVVYKNHSQVYGTSNIKIALDSPPPEGLTQEDKNIFFLTFEPDSNNICLHKYNGSDKTDEVHDEKK